MKKVFLELSFLIVLVILGCHVHLHVGGKYYEYSGEDAIKFLEQDGEWVEINRGNKPNAPVDDSSPSRGNNPGNP